MGEMMKKKTKNSENGQSMVELAISLTFLLFIIAGLVDFGRAFGTFIAVRDAAQEGASFAAVARTAANDPMFCNDVTARVQSTSGTLQGWSDAGEIQITTTINGVNCASANAATACLGSAVEVEVEFTNFPLVTPFLGTIIGTQSITLRATAIDTILTPPCQ